MAEKTFRSRIVNKHDTEANWLKATNFYPLEGEIIIYDVDDTHDRERMKIGDGVTLVSDLPFMNDGFVISEDGKELSSNDYTDAEKAKLQGIAAGAEVNQNAFSSVKVGSSTISADSKTDTLTLTAGSNVTLTPDTSTDTIIIAATDTKYTHPTYSARTGVPSANATPGFGDAFSVSQPISDGTGHITAINSRTVTIPSNTATTTDAGLMSASDKSKLDGITAGADAVAFTRSLSAGTKIGTITINGEATDLYCEKDTNTTYSVATTSKDGLMSASDKSKLDGVTAGAEVNQNAFSNVAIGSTTISADSKTDTLTIAAGSNVTITPDATNDKITIAAKDTVYTHPSYTARTGVPAADAAPEFGGTFQVSQPISDASGHITAVNSRTVTIPSTTATTIAAGLMSVADKTKLDGIAAGATKVTVDSTLSSTSANPVQNKAVNTALASKVPTSRTINGKALTGNITLTASDVGADASGAAASALTNAKAYTDSAVAALVDSAPETLDTLSEVATAIQDNESVVAALNSAIGNKVDKVDGKGLSTNDYTTAEKNKLAGIASGAEVNQNAFSNVTVGSTTIAADSKTDTLTIVAGSNVTITPDATNDKITIAAKDTVYTHPTYTARTGVPAANATPGFGGTFKVSQPVSDGTGHITAVNSRTITIPSATATTSAAGLMSADDKSKLDGITAGADTVSFSPALTSGTKVGTITINGTGTDLYCETNTNTTYSAATTSAAGLMSASDKSKLDAITASADAVSFSPSLTSGTKVGTITINGTGTDLYCEKNTNTTYDAATTSAAGLMSAADKTKLNGIATGAEVNQNAFSNVKVGTTTIAADAKTDTLTLAAGSNITLTPDATSDTVTIAATDTVYTHPTYTARTGVPTANATPGFGGTFSVSQPVSDGTGHITAVNSRTITIPNTAATTSAAGLMSASDKTKLGATNVAYGTCATAAATAEKVITISGNTNWTLTAGSIIVVKFSYTNTAQNPTFNVAGTGAKSVLYNTAVITTGSLSYAGYANRYGEYIYDGTQYVFIGWSYDANSTYSNASLGQGYGTCSTAEATVAKVVTLSSYALTKGGIVSVKFTYAVPAGATMNINSKGAKAIFYRGSAIIDGIIAAGDVATFIYDGTQYHLLTVDRHRFFTMLVPYGVAISTEGTDLNNVDYLKVGNYYCSANATAKTLLNCPTAIAFMMQVYSPLSTAIDNETSKAYIYRVRKLLTYQGDEYIQYCSVGATAGTWTYGSWKKIVQSDDTATTSAAGLMSAADKAKLDGIAAGATANTGDITGVTAGNGLTGGGSSGSVTLAVGAGAGLTVSADAIGHTNSVTAGTASEGGSARTLAFGGSFNVPSVTYDAQGHITGKGSIALKLPSNPNTDTGATSVEVTGSGNAVTAASYDASTRKLTLTKGSTYNNYSLPTASSSTLGGVKTTSTVTSTSGLTACPIISGVPYYKDTNTTYTHPTYTARTGVPTANATPGFGGTFKVSQPVSDGTGHITAVNSRTITIPNATATTSAAGLMSTTDKSKVDRIGTVYEGTEYYISRTASNWSTASDGAKYFTLSTTRFNADRQYAVMLNTTCSGHEMTTSNASALKESWSLIDRIEITGTALTAYTYSSTLPSETLYLRIIDLS